MIILYIILIVALICLIGYVGLIIFAVWCAGAGVESHYAQDVILRDKYKKHDEDTQNDNSH